MAQGGFTFLTHRIHVLPYYPKEPIIFPHLRQYHSTPSFLNKPDIDSYQDITSNFPSPDDANPFNNFQSHTCFEPIAQSKSNSHFLLLIKTFLLFLFHMITLMIPSTLVTLIQKCFIIIFIILHPFQKHFPVLLTHLNVYLSFLRCSNFTYVYSSSSFSIYFTLSFSWRLQYLETYH